MIWNGLRDWDRAGTDCCGLLLRLELHTPPGLDGQLAAALVAGCPRLEQVLLLDCGGRVNLSAAAVLLQGLPQLELLRINGSDKERSHITFTDLPASEVWRDAEGPMRFIPTSMSLEGAPSVPEDAKGLVDSLPLAQALVEDAAARLASLPGQPEQAIPQQANEYLSQYESALHRACNVMQERAAQAVRSAAAGGDADYRAEPGLVGKVQRAMELQLQLGRLLLQQGARRYPMEVSALVGRCSVELSLAVVWE